MLPLLLLPVVHAGPDTALVGLSSPEDAASVVAFAAQNGASARCWAPLCVVEPVSEAGLSALRALPGLRYVERDRELDRVPTRAPSPVIDGTADCPDLWALEAIGVEAAWAAVGDRGADAPAVAIQDTGFLLSHLDLGAVSGQYDYGDGDTIPEVSWASGVPGHGTFIAGLVAAPDDNDLGRVGVLPDGAMNLQKIADSSGALYFSYAVSAMLDLAEGDLGVGVLNYSIASSSTTAAFDDAVAALGAADILLVAAAANCSSPDCPEADNDDHPLYPANSPGEHVVSVAGSTRDDDLNPYSHYGAYTVDLAAPGVDLCSLDVGSDDDTAVAAGTSYAAPLVAATAALVRGAWPRLSTTEVARVLRASAVETPGLADVVRAGGRLSAEGAVQTALASMSAPTDVVVDGRGDLALSIDSRAAAGAATVLLVHGGAVAVADLPDGWSATEHAAGDTVTLPDAGDHTLSRGASVLTGPLPADDTAAVVVTLSGRAVGAVEATLRLAATSPGADYLSAPYNTGNPDETGFLAETVTLDVRAVDDQPVGDTGADGTDGSDGSDGSDGGVSAGAGDPGETKGGCQAAPTGAGLVLAGLGLLAAARRQSA